MWMIGMFGLNFKQGFKPIYWNGVSYTNVFGHSGISLFGNRVSEKLCFV